MRDEIISDNFLVPLLHKTSGKKVIPKGEITTKNTIINLKKKFIGPFHLFGE